jgi:hypothetical protein
VTTKPFLHFSKTIRNDKKVEEWKRIRTWKDSNLHRTDFQTTAPHRATGTDDILCTFCQLWIRINRSCDVCTVSVDIIQPIYLGKETSNQLGFCPNWGACVAACKWQLCSCGPLQYFFGPPNIVFSWGGRLPPPLVCKWFNGGCDRLCWAMSKIRSLQTSPLHARGEAVADQTPEASGTSLLQTRAQWWLLQLLGRTREPCGFIWTNWDYVETDD